MDFSKLKLVEGVSSSNNLAIGAEAKTSDAATNVSAPAQVNPARKEMQMKQRTAKIGSPKTPQTMMNSFDALQQHKELIKMREAAKADWRKELMEAANPDDDPDHPYVEVMPHYQYRQKEAMENLKKAQMKDKAQGTPNPALSGVKEEYKGKLDPEKKSRLIDKGNKLANKANDREEFDAKRIKPRYNYGRDIKPLYLRAKRMQDLGTRKEKD